MAIATPVYAQLVPDEPASEAAAQVLLKLLETIDDKLPGALQGTDPEGLHDFRVAVRRTRAVQRQLRAVFADEPLSRFRSEFRWLQRTTGRTRDLDVYVLGFDHQRTQLPDAVRADLGPLLSLLQEQRTEARHEMVAALWSDRTHELLSDWREFVEAVRRARVQPGPRAAETISAVAGGRISHVYRRMVKMGNAIDSSTPPADYHELRKRGKELRYLLELFGKPLYPDRAVKPMIKRLKALQDTLGRHQDSEVQVALLRSLSDAVAAQRRATNTLIAIGMLVERLDEDAAEARAEFAERFAVFASKSQRKKVKRTFA